MSLGDTYNGISILFFLSSATNGKRNPMDHYVEYKSKELIKNKAFVNAAN